MNPTSGRYLSKYGKVAVETTEKRLKNEKFKENKPFECQEENWIFMRIIFIST